MKLTQAAILKHAFQTADDIVALGRDRTGDTIANGIAGLAIGAIPGALTGAVSGSFSKQPADAKERRAMILRRAIKGGLMTGVPFGLFRAGRTLGQGEGVMTVGTEMGGNPEAGL